MYDKLPTDEIEVNSNLMVENEMQQEKIDMKDRNENKNSNGQIENHSQNNDFLINLRNMNKICREWMISMITSVISLIILLIFTFILIMSVNPCNVTSIINNTHNKADQLKQLPNQLNLNATKICDINDINQYLNDDKMFPLIFKPAVCTTSGQNLKIIKNKQNAIEYIQQRDAR